MLSFFLTFGVPLCLVRPVHVKVSVRGQVVSERVRHRLVQVLEEAPDLGLGVQGEVFVADKGDLLRVRHLEI